RLLQPHAALAKMHQHLVHGQTMQPGRKRRLAAETPNLAKELDKDFLRQVFGLSHILGHAQAERIDATVVTLIKLLEGFHVAVGAIVIVVRVRIERLVKELIRAGMAHSWREVKEDLTEPLDREDSPHLILDLSVQDFEYFP